MKIAVLEPLGIAQNTLEDILNSRLPKEAKITYYANRKEDVLTLIKRSQDAEIVVMSNLPFPKEVMERCPQLKAIMVAFTGVDHIDMEYCRQKNITVCNCAGYATAAVADLVFGMLISFYRQLPACDDRARHGGTKDGLIGDELEGKNFGIIGTGAIGERVAAIANAFGCRVYAYSRTQKPLANVTYVPFDELLKISDILSLHIPATKETHHLIGARELRKMKPNAVLVNTARGAVVDEAALTQALLDHQLRGACLDVLQQEPPFDATLAILREQHALITPHIGFASVQSMQKRAILVAENLKAYLAGHPIHVV